MLTPTMHQPIQNADMVNSLNEKGFAFSNSGLEINREVLLGNYTPSIVQNAWNVLSQFIAKNYYSGKGTFIKGFGTFTFDNFDVDLEGTTNQYSRDKKKRTPVFILSPEFSTSIQPGQFTSNGNIIYYTQKLNNAVNIVKVNYAEIAYCLSISKDECHTLIQHLIHHLKESIIMGNLRNKEFPGVGTLVLNRNVLGVKFNSDLVEASRMKPRKLQFTKKSIQLGMDMRNAQKAKAFELETPYKNVEELRPEVAVLTKVEKDAQVYMKEKLQVDLNEIPEHEEVQIHQPFVEEKSFPLRFINDNDMITLKGIKKKKVNVNSFKLKDLHLHKSILDAFEFYKGTIISKMKEYDQNKTGVISIEQCIQALIDSNINSNDNSNQITNDIIQKIVHIYSNKLQCIDYMKFITCLIKDAKNIMTSSLYDVNTMFPKTTTHKSLNTNEIASLTSFRNNSLTKSTNLPHTSTTSCRNKPQASLNAFTTSIGEPSNSNTCINDTNSQFLSIKRKEVDSVFKELTVLKKILPNLKLRKRLELDQRISYIEFMNILEEYSIMYPKEQIINILTFLEIPNINAFTLLEFESHIKNSSILNTKLSSDEITKTFNHVKDITFINGGQAFLFPNNSTEISLSQFINTIQEKAPGISTESLTSVFNYLVKTNRNFNINDYNNYFVTNAKYDPAFESRSLKQIINAIENRHLKYEEFFDHLLTYNVSTNNKVITRKDFINIMQKEKFAFNAEELNHIFSYIDSKKDGVIDREEFLAKVQHEQHPFTYVQCVVRNNNLDIEDLAHKMGISIHKNEHFTFEEFTEKMKKLDYTFGNDFIYAMFHKLKRKNCNYVDSDTLLNEMNMKYRDLAAISKTPPTIFTIGSFKEGYMNTVRNNATFNQLKQAFEKVDQNCQGLLTKEEFSSVLNKHLSMLSDDDNMKFCRITNMYDNSRRQLVKYPQWLNLIFYNESQEPFNHLLHVLINYIKQKHNSNINNFLSKIVSAFSNSGNDFSKGIPIDIFHTFLIKNLENENTNTIPSKAICKLDIDADGFISREDLISVIRRYDSTSFFKYENKEMLPNINLYPSETIKESTFKGIVKQLKQIIKAQNINEIGLFKKLDKNNDGFISIADFNSTIDDLLQLAPSIKDQFFNYLDYYHNGLVDLETFVFRFKDFTSDTTLPRNNNKIENTIITSFSNFINKNPHLSDTEVFSLLDKDSDGLININDLKQFIIHTLDISSFEFNDYKLERVMQAISLSKNKQIGINDIKEFIDKSKSSQLQKYHINLKEICKVTTNMNLYPNKENTEWISEIIERFGMFISEKYDCIQHFFEENTEKGSDKFKLEDFMKFHDNNYECFNNGFNLTKDELLAIYTSLDSQKKNYLTVDDLENKLNIFDFYKKMHIDVKTFIKQNFYNSVDAFKFFSKNTSLSLHTITYKEFFDAFQNFFPNKYSTSTIMKYINKYFNIPHDKCNNASISYSKFTYIYFDKIESDMFYINNKPKATKLFTSRTNEIMSKSQTDFHIKDPLLKTPFDNDALNKIKRIIKSTRYDLEKFFDYVKGIAIDGIVNKYQFRNIIKQLNLGLSNIEIDDIIKQSGVTFDGKINLNNFIMFLKTDDKYIHEGTKNVNKIISDIKSLIYKYYSNPVICFQVNDTRGIKQIDFDKFKMIICEMYKNDRREAPNFTMLKNAFDSIDLRKDGVIDLNEWTRSFGSVNGSLDYNGHNVKNGFNFFASGKNFYKSKDAFFKGVNRQILREWESSKDICDIYKIISKNKRYIRESLKQYSLNESGDVLVQSDNLLNVLKEILPKMKLSHTQWRMLVMIGQSDIENLIDLNMFFKLVDKTAKNVKSHPNPRI